MTNNITLSDAVDLLFHGKCNVCDAAKAAGVENDLLKRLLLERVKSKPEMAPLQLSLPII